MKRLCANEMKMVNRADIVCKIMLCARKIMEINDKLHEMIE